MPIVRHKHSGNLVVRKKGQRLLASALSLLCFSRSALNLPGRSVHWRSRRYFGEAFGEAFGDATGAAFGETTGEGLGAADGAGFITAVPP